MLIVERRLIRSPEISQEFDNLIIGLMGKWNIIMLIYDYWTFIFSHSFYPLSQSILL